jgi:hypothetical protein
MTHDEALALGPSAGGRAMAQKLAPPTTCPRGCGKTWKFGDSWMAYLGHLGLHKLADNYFGGDIKAAQRRLGENGRARQEQGASWQNGASPVYRPVTKP